jgi:pilus assembly protein CpaB
MVFGLVLLAGLGLAGFAVKMAMDYIGAYEAALAQERQKTAEQIPTTPIYLARRPLAYGERLTAKDVVLAPYPTDFLPEGHFGETNPVVIEGDAPRLVLRAMEAHEPLLAVKVSEPGGDAGLASRLKRGERAFAIKVDVSSGVSGFLRPGDKVDIYWTGRAASLAADRAEGEITRLIESAVRLIAIDQSAQAETAEAAIARTVTVAASREQVAALAQAQSTGRLSLSLVPLGDETGDPDEPIEVDAHDLLGIEDPEILAAAPEPAAPKNCTIRTRRGAEVVETPIPCTY